MSNQTTDCSFSTASPGESQAQVKVLIPSIAAGAIIGKGGDTISQIQKDTGANIKMSKANDFYPGKGPEQTSLAQYSAHSYANLMLLVIDA